MFILLMILCSGKKHSLPFFLNVPRLKINEYYRQAQGLKPRLRCGDLCGCLCFLE